MIFAVWDVIAGSVAGLCIACLGDFGDDFRVTAMAILTNLVFMMKVALLLDFMSLPCLLVLIAFVVLLGRITSDQQRRVAAEVNMLGNSGMVENPNIPQRQRSYKSTRYGPFRSEWIRLSLWLRWFQSDPLHSKLHVEDLTGTAKPKTKPNPLV